MEYKSYPKPKVERKNPAYAEILMQDYAGNVSETTAVMLYMYQHMDKFDEEREFAKILEEIAIAEMHHLELLGETIKLLGVDPVYGSIHTTNNTFEPWTSNNISYVTNIIEMLKIDIESEKKAIEMYKLHRKMIDDKYIQALLTRILEDENEHLQIFKSLLNKFASNLSYN